MNVALLIIAGILGGIFGGMGMGGGTLLIPLLTLMCKIPQHTAQAINLASFVPMAVAALIVHVKAKKVDFKDILYIIVPASIVSAVGALLASVFRPEILSRLFGGFLAVLGVVQLVVEIVGICKKQKSDRAVSDS